MAKAPVICTLLVIVTVALYARVATFGFITLDDNQFITDNAFVSEGLSVRGVVWAFGLDAPTGYSPLAWVSHMIDCSLFGVDQPGAPGKHHLVNVLFHAANGVMLFVLLWRMTGALWRSAAAALLFAIHPLHVESVAWIAERRDVMSMFGCLLALLAYVRYAKAPSIRRYLLVTICFVFALLSKPMAVTLPCVMLLLDYWPLGRVTLKRSTLVRLTIEKLPLLALSVLSSILTFILQSRAGIVRELEATSISYRLQNTVVAYGTYLLKMIRPTDLAAHYARPVSWVAAHVVIASCFLVVTTALCVFLARRRPYLIVGWLWYLGAMVPMVGLVSIGGLWMADRYSYLPLIGIYIASVWAIADLCAAARISPGRIAGVAAAVYVVLAVVCWLQIGYWQNSMTLYRHTLQVAPHNALIHNNLANLLVRRHQADDWTLAETHYQLAIEQQSTYWDAHYNYAKLLMYENRYREALLYLAKAEKSPPSKQAHAKTLYVTGVARLKLGDRDLAKKYLDATLELMPDHAKAKEQMVILQATRPAQ